jgi:hypothetical protein
MIKRKTKALGAVFFCAQATGSLAASPIDLVPPATKQTAECMAQVMRATPGTMDVEVGAMRDNYGYYAFVQYAFQDTSGKRRLVRLNLRHEPSEGYYLYRYPFDEVNGGPLTEEVHQSLRMTCRATSVIEIE